MLPEGFTFYDPSKINEGDLIDFYNHVIGMEHPAEPGVAPVRFKFYQFELGTAKNRTYHPAVYSGTVERPPRRRTKKSVTVPEFEGPPPSPADDTSSAGASQTASPAPEISLPSNTLAAALSADIEAIRAEIAAEKAAESGARAADSNPARNKPAKPRRATHRKSTSQSHSPIPTPLDDSTVAEANASTDDATADDLPIALSRPRRDVSNARSPIDASSSPWVAAEIDASHVFSDESSLTDEDVYKPAAERESEDSDDEVEDCLNVDLAHEIEDLSGPVNEADSSEENIPPQPHMSKAPMVHGNALPPATSAADAIYLQSLVSTATAGVGVSPATTLVMAAPVVAPPDAALVAPSAITANAPARLAFLKSLAADDEYIALLARMEHHVRQNIQMRTMFAR